MRANNPGLVYFKDHILVRRVMVWVSVAIVLGGIASAAAMFQPLRKGALEIAWRFSLDGEANFGGWFSAVALLYCGHLLFLVAQQKHPAISARKRAWKSLAIIFVLLSIDEYVGVHELINGPLNQALHAHGFLNFTWVLGGLAFAIVVLGSMLGLLRSLPRPYLAWFLAAGVCYVGGAVFMESISGKMLEAHGTISVQYWTSTIIEESMELSGISAFVCALTSFLNYHAALGASAEPNAAEPYAA